MLKTLLITIFLSACSQISLIDTKEEKVSNTKAQVTSNEKSKVSGIPTKKIKNSSKINSFCNKLETRFKDFNWSKANCDLIEWNSVRTSHYGNPIMWTEFVGSEVRNTTILMCGVHPDEITPVKFCFDIINDLRQKPELYKYSKVIIAPIVTTDPFFYGAPTRTNSRKIDVNRNFPTKDWSADALRLWKTRYYKNKRRYPGAKSNSEQETIFQVNLIKLYNPQYVISVHAPLRLLDYDGPALTTKDGKTTKELLYGMSSKAGNYKVANYPFFPGSLGNWAGNERQIPTFTLELPNSDWNKTDKYFDTFSPAVYHVFNFKK